jgi:hypothetical protein
MLHVLTVPIITSLRPEQAYALLGILSIASAITLARYIR